LFIVIEIFQLKMSGLPKEALDQLKAFVTLVKTKPDVLHTPELLFFKEFLESFGCKVPGATAHNKTPKATPEPTPAPADPESEESDIELDNTGVIGG
jgi:suppressor of tumorigenicity protein 13